MPDDARKCPVQWRGSALSREGGTGEPWNRRKKNIDTNRHKCIHLAGQRRALPGRGSEFRFHHFREIRSVLNFRGNPRYWAKKRVWVAGDGLRATLGNWGIGPRFRVGIAVGLCASMLMRWMACMVLIHGRDVTRGSGRGAFDVRIANFDCPGRFLTPRAR